MRTVFSIVLLAAAVVLLTLGVQAADSLASSFSRLFSGAPTDRSVWLLVAGAACAVVGVVSLMRAPRVAR